ncbi:Bacterial sugar transferase [Shewanella psychrophila]|uniref:Bacterial sugar transferase n=1 Tax=Shewanella psychrophila TaxID=225848 RepID=A0A1S6HTN0_9GAMM|nr:Bacterial sugar transferase [Shewanella psychrophila]
MKRVFDFITALFCLLILSPVLLVVTIMVKVKLGGSDFFFSS